MKKCIDFDKIDEIRKGKTLVTTNGSFDVLHVAHLRILQKAKAMGDLLLILLNSDISVKLNKGETRPIVPEEERMELLAGLECVDYILKFDDKEVQGVLEKIKPDVHVKGGTFIPKRVQVEKDLVEKHGGKHICLGKIGEYSTTNLIEKIQDLHQKER